MLAWILQRPLNQKLALGAVALGAIALFAQPYPGTRVTLDARELALTAGTGADEVEAPELAAWIIEGRADYRLIDLRADAEFSHYHIPTAVNIPIAGLSDAGLGRQEKLVLYSDGGIQSAQAWILLKAQGYKAVYMLRGGLDDWRNQVLYPTVADSATPEERTRDERLRSVAAFFGGQPRSAAAVAAGAPNAPATVAAALPAAPKVVAPPSPAGGAKPAAKKKKEGC